MEWLLFPKCLDRTPVCVPFAGSITNPASLFLRLRVGQGVESEARFRAVASQLKGALFAFQRVFGSVWRYSGCHTIWRGVSDITRGMPWVRARDSATHPTMHRTAPQQKLVQPKKLRVLSEAGKLSCSTWSIQILMDFFSLPQFPQWLEEDLGINENEK